MAQTHKPKPPLDVLQSMVNGILIEVGKALRASEKESGRTFASANTRLKSTIPSAIDNFQLALDELECDILRSKAVILRDLNEKRAQRIARENPVIIPDPIVIEDEPMIVEPFQLPDSPHNDANSAFDEQIPEDFLSAELIQPTQALSAIPNSTPSVSAMQPEQTQKTPIPAETATQTASKPVGLGINTEGMDLPNTATTPAPDTAITNPQSSINSLFDEDEGDNPDTDLFGAMDFTDTQTLDFGNSNTTQTYEDTNKSLNDMFDMGPTTGADVPDIDMGLSAEESAFDDLLWGDADAGNGEFDDSFFEMET